MSEKEDISIAPSSKIIEDGVQKTDHYGDETLDREESPPQSIHLEISEITAAVRLLDWNMGRPEGEYRPY